MKTFKRGLSERKEKRWRLSAQHKKDPPLPPPPPPRARAPPPPPSPPLAHPSFSFVCRPLSSSAHNLATHPPSSPPLPAFRFWQERTHTQRRARARGEGSAHTDAHAWRFYSAATRTDIRAWRMTHIDAHTQPGSVNKKPSAVRGRRHSTPPSCHCD